MKPAFLNIGCGPRGDRTIPAQFIDWTELRMDIEPRVFPDIIGSITSIDLADNSVDGVYASHVLEHVEQWEVQTALVEVLRVLKPDGTAIILTPDLVMVAQEIVANPDKIEAVGIGTVFGPVSMLDVLFGYQPAIKNGAEYMRHHTAFTQQTLGEHLQVAGFHGGFVMAQNGQLVAVARKGEDNGKEA